jgi:hypothetical protein
VLSSLKIFFRKSPHLQWNVATTKNLPRDNFSREKLSHGKTLQTIPIPGTSGKNSPVASTHVKFGRQRQTKTNKKNFDKELWPIPPESIFFWKGYPLKPTSPRTILTV